MAWTYLSLSNILTLHWCLCAHNADTKMGHGGGAGMATWGCTGSPEMHAPLPVSQGSGPCSLRPHTVQHAVVSRLQRALWYRLSLCFFQ